MSGLIPGSVLLPGGTQGGEGYYGLPGIERLGQLPARQVPFLLCNFWTSGHLFGDVLGMISNGMFHVCSSSGVKLCLIVRYLNIDHTSSMNSDAALACPRAWGVPLAPQQDSDLTVSLLLSLLCSPHLSLRPRQLRN